MEKDYEIKYHNLEEGHWWFYGRRNILLKLMARKEKCSNILEIGCSGGRFLELLLNNNYTTIWGIDISKVAIKHCNERGLKNVFVMDGSKTAFNENTFDILIASDVIEHIKNDIATLREWNRILKYGGCMIIFSPAFNFLWSAHDEKNKHYKRYSMSELISLLKESGFIIQKSSYWNFSLFVPISLTRILSKYFKGSSSEQLYKTNFIINKFLTGLLMLENFFLPTLCFPFGVSIFAIAHKGYPNHLSHKTVSISLLNSLKRYKT